LDRIRILTLLRALNRELRKQRVVGEVVLCGGAVMCVVFRSRESTKDIGAAFAPTRQMRKAIKGVAARFDLPADWLNDAAKGFFLSDPPRRRVLGLSHLRVWAARADYMLAMKCVAARFDTHDVDDVRFLIGHLRLKSPEAVFSIIEKYYPRRLVPAKTRFLVEEIFSQS
jgi:hypothetical protein